MNKRGQVWIETMIYTLVAFALIGAVLAFAKPKIEEIQDQAITEQSIEVLDKIDSLINSAVQGGNGNKRLLEIGIKKGELIVDGVNDKLIFILEGRYVYSQPGKVVDLGRITALTESRGKYNQITLTKNYSGNYDIMYNKNPNGEKTFGKSSTPYKIFITNLGESYISDETCPGGIGDCPVIDGYTAACDAAICRYDGSKLIINFELN
jgi:hypothetical protein